MTLERCIVRRLLQVCAIVCACVLICLSPYPRVSADSEPIRSQLPGGTLERAIRSGGALTELVPAQLPLQEGERLVYNIRVNGLSAGKTQLLVKKCEKCNEDGPATWVIEMETRSNRAVSLFYNVESGARSYVDVKGGFSRFYHIIKKEGDVKTEEKISFKYDIGDMEATYERPRSEPSDEERKWRIHKIPLTSKVLDPLCALYYLRSIDFKLLCPGNTSLSNQESACTISLPICADREVWNTRITVLPPGIAVGDFGSLRHRKYVKIRPEIEFKGLFERKGTMLVWLDLETRIPLKMEVEVPIGHAEVLLSEYENSPLRPANK